MQVYLAGKRIEECSTKTVASKLKHLKQRHKELLRIYKAGKDDLVLNERDIKLIEQELKKRK